MSKNDPSFLINLSKTKFISNKASKIRNIYFPLCGTSSGNIKSSISPFLSGDIKINKSSYLTKPASREDLRVNVRNFFLDIEGKKIISLADNVEEKDAVVEIGQLWHKLTKSFAGLGIEMSSLNFIPVTGENVEIMKVSVRNISKNKISFTPTAAVPIFARALENKHDHEHVTALLNRIKQKENGVVVQPTMIFDEKGHKENDNAYFVCGITDTGENPVGTFPTIDSFLGDNGTISEPAAIFNHCSPKRLNEKETQGKEAFGVLQFKKISLGPGKEKNFIIVIGVEKDEGNISKTFKKFNEINKVEKALNKNEIYWAQKTHSLIFDSNDENFDSWMKWVTLQPVLRRIFGCSFLPDHDYGKGGKGWRDIWQDLLSLILIEPESVRGNLISNFAGVRIDGTNATIIGTPPAQFIADRNSITRVWMDHGVWPFLTLLLYINQTGDFDILLEENTYFKDKQMSRTFEKDNHWSAKYGNLLKDKNGRIYKGNLIEHILIQHLVQFFNVGKHNITRLESADWNDGFDMAFKNGECVAFMSLYAGNLVSLADLLDKFSIIKNIKEIEIAKEIKILLDTTSIKIDYDNAGQKKDLLFKKYFSSVQPELNGEKIKIKIDEVIKDLRTKADWVFNHIRKNEIIEINKGGNKYKFFNGYYDNKGNRVEGMLREKIRMTLTGQVFPIMSGLAKNEDIENVVISVNKFVKDKKFNGFRLNSDFGVKNYLDLGRAFGFAYGTKENGAFFSHMTVMYANALYKRGFVRAGYEVLKSIYKMSIDINKSKIYPGIPEYFDSEGRGMYHYLTGSASWFVLTKLIEVFGVAGYYGDLSLNPKLVKEEFKNNNGIAKVSCKFAGKRINVCYENKRLLDYGKYKIKEIFINGKPGKSKENINIIKRDFIKKISGEVNIKVILDKN